MFDFEETGRLRKAEQRIEPYFYVWRCRGWHFRLQAWARWKCRVPHSKRAQVQHAVIDVVGLAFNTKYIVERAIFYFILKC